MSEPTIDMMPLTRIQPILCACLVLVAICTASAADDAATVKTVLNKYCIDCHDADSKKGDLDLDALNAANLSTNGCPT